MHLVTARRSANVNTLKDARDGLTRRFISIGVSRPIG